MQKQINEGAREQQQGEEKGGKWKAPRQGWIKMNTDAACQLKEKKARWGIVARDWKGEVLAA